MENEETLPAEIPPVATQEEQLDASHLFVRDEKRIRGPFVVGALQAMQRRGELRRESLLSPDRVRWVAASDLPHLFPPEHFERLLPVTVDEMQWHYLSEGQRHGPVSWETIQTMAAAGTLQPLDSVLPENSQAWIPARAVDGLTFQTDDDLLGIVRYRKLWLFGSITFVLLMLVIPTVLILTWDEGRIRRDNMIADREDEQQFTELLQDHQQQHESVLAKMESETQKTLANIESITRKYEAEVHAAIRKVEIQEEKERFEREMKKLDEVAASNDRVAQAKIDAANIEADARRDAAAEIADGERDRGRMQKEGDEKVANAIRDLDD